MKKIAHIITGLNNGGAEAVLYRLVTNDTHHKHVVVSLMGMGKYGPMLEEKGIEVVCLNMPQGKLTLGGVLTLWKTLRKHKPNVVQTWMYHADFIGGLVAKFAGVKNIFWNIRHTDLVPGESSKATILIARLCAKISAFVPTKIVCCAERAAEVHAELGYKKDKMVVIGNGYELSHFRVNEALDAETRQTLGIEADMPLLGKVGRFNAQKDHKNLLQALAILKNKDVDFRALLIGPSMDEHNAELMGWIEQNQLQDNLLLLSQRTDIPALMNAMDVHILSSSFGEAFPNVLAEAMACGTPCVTTDVGDAGLIVSDTGWVVPPRNAEDLADAIEQALLEKKNKPEAWQQRKQASRARIEENFSVEKMVAKYHGVWGIYTS